MIGDNLDDTNKSIFVSEMEIIFTFWFHKNYVVSDSFTCLRGGGVRGNGVFQLITADSSAFKQKTKINVIFFALPWSQPLLFLNENFTSWQDIEFHGQLFDLVM